MRARAQWRSGMADNGSEQSAEQLAKISAVGGDDVQEKLAREFGLEILTDLSQVPFLPDQPLKVPYAFVKRHLALPIEERNGEVIVAVNDPLNLESLEELQLMLKLPTRAVYVPREVLTGAIDSCYNRGPGAASQMLSDLSEARVSGGDDELEVYDLLDDSASLPPIVRLLNLILSEAIQQNASDIHFEPQESGLRVRYRIDGVLQDRHAPAHEYQSQLLTRIKVMSQMDIAERRLPQDGRIKLRMGKREVDFRVSTVPTTYGERVVLRILDKGTVVLGLDSVGMHEETYSLWRRLMRMPEGILLVTGPTGSGKTTTLYSTIAEICSDEVNIMTIEDPVEYKLPGIAQIGVRPKINLTFASGLRHILRQDPDVIMVGEIRDHETAEIAIQASLTGHLVMSTLHTNDAPSAVTRLVDMGVEPYLIASSVVGVLAQRLVRRVCDQCEEKYTPSDEELARIGLSKKDLKNGQTARGKGCNACYHSGYRGRHGVYELMPVTSRITAQIARSADAGELRKLAINEGMRTLREDGARLVREGVTTIAEVLRVSRGTED